MALGSVRADRPPRPPPSTDHPAVEGPQHRNEGQPERRHRKAPGWHGRREMATGFRQTDDERQQDDDHQAAVLGDGGEILHQRAPPQSDHIDRRHERQCAGGQVVGVIVVRSHRGVVPQGPDEILPERERNTAQGRGADEREFGPAVEERWQASPRFADVHEVATRAREGPRQFGQRQRTAECKQTAGGPHGQQRQGSRQLVRDAGRRAEDTGTDRGADEHGDRTPQAKLAREFSGRRGSRRGAGIGRGVGAGRRGGHGPLC